MSEQDYTSILEYEIKREFEDLIIGGYVYKGITKKVDKPLLGTIYKANLVNHKAKRRLIITFIKWGEKDEQETLFIEISLGGVSSAYRVYDYLKQFKYKSEIIETFKLENYQGELKERLRSCLSVYKNFLQNDAKNIVSGVEWVEVKRPTAMESLQEWGYK